MNILLNDTLTFSAETDDTAFHILSVTGLGVADIRTSSFLFSGRSGGLVTDQFLGFRTIALIGRVGKNNNSKAQHALDRQAVLDALPIGETIPVEITNFAGDTYKIEANVTDAKIEYRQGGRSSDCLIQLTAGDPLFYSTDGGDEQSALVTRVTQGGYVTPYDLPVDWASGSSPTVVTNTGEAVYYPRIELHDQADNPVITNQTTGERFELDINLVTSDVVIIDMFKRTVTLNGSNIIGNKTDDSVWWGLQVGANSIVLDSSSGSDDVTAEIFWRNGVRGI